MSSTWVFEDILMSLMQLLKISKISVLSKQCMCVSHPWYVFGLSIDKEGLQKLVLTVN